MTSRSSKLLVCAVLAAAPLMTCKTAQEALSPLAAVDPADSKPAQCNTGAGFRGSCHVTDVTGRQGMSTEAARESALGEVTELRLTVPPGGAEAHTQVRFFRKAGPIDDWAVEHGLDLYSRAGCIAEVNGGVFGDGFTPKITLRVLVNLQDDGRTAFAELSDYRTGKPAYATLALKCDWQK